VIVHDVFESTVRNSVRTGTGHEYGQFSFSPSFPASHLASRLWGIRANRQKAGISPNAKGNGSSQGLRPVQRMSRVAVSTLLWLIRPWLESVGPMGGCWAGNLATSKIAGTHAYSRVFLAQISTDHRVKRHFRLHAK
jgi:hypothetical protein